MAKDGLPATIIKTSATGSIVECSAAGKLELPVEEAAKRRYLTPKERAAMALKQEGRCGCGCGAKLEPDAIGEHVIPLQMGNSEKPDALYNRACAKAKTKQDVADIARAKRRRRKHLTGRGRAPKGRKLEGNKKWPKKSFPKRKKSLTAS